MQVIGSSTGYGLASCITASFGYGAKTLGVFYERPAADDRTASAGWCNAAAFQKYAEQEGLYAKNLCADAFTGAAKQKIVETIREDMGAVDLVIYSLAAPRRTHPVSGEPFRSVLKPVGKPVVSLGLDIQSGQVSEFALEPATDEEIRHTVGVTGGEDWQMWVDTLRSAGVLAKDAKTTAYTYLSGRITWDLYWNGSIGEAKKDLDSHAFKMNSRMSMEGGKAAVSVLKCVVTQASAAIPVLPLYASLLIKEMKKAGTHEGCIEQLYRLFTECIYSEQPRFDDAGRYRVDNLELRPEIQQEIKKLVSDNHGKPA